MPGTLPLVFVANCPLAMAGMDAAPLAAGARCGRHRTESGRPGLLRRAGALRAGPDHG
jgi:hypothetical protein